MMLDRVIKWLLPQENRFFGYLDALARNLTAGADEFAKLGDAVTTDDFVRVADAMRRIEHEGDEVAHVFYDELDKTFVTPIDREDLHDLVSALDDIIDLMEECAGLIVIYRVGALTGAMRDLVRLIRECANAVAHCVQLLRAGGDNHSELQMWFVRVHALENEGDAAYRNAVGLLFQNPPDPIDLIREKEILDALEKTIDACDDVCDLIRSVVVKHG